MKLIAESGSTKTDWRVIKSQVVTNAFTTLGMNPVFIDGETILKELSEKFPKKIEKENITEVYFYGAGCSIQQRAKIVYDALAFFFNHATIYIYHDLLAAARALFHSQQGIAAILGTGSSTCFYDGNNIIQSFPGLGYILGDEGSGAHLGTNLIKAFLTRQLSNPMHNAFIEEFNITKDQIIETVYTKPLPNKFLASFTPFIKKHIDDESIFMICYNCFDAFFRLLQFQYQKIPQQIVRLSGSVAYNFQETIELVAKLNDVKIDKIIKNPIDELIIYHTKTKKN